MKQIIVCAHVLVVCQLTAAQAVPISRHSVVTSFQEGVGGYGSTVDTALIASFPDTDFSNFDELGVAASLGPFPSPRQGLLRFDDIFGDGSGQVPYGANLLSATLSLTRFGFVTTPNASGHRMFVSWADTDTFNSLGGGVQVNGIEAAATPDFIGLGDGSVPRLAPQTFDVLTAVQAWQSNPTANFGWVLTGGGDSTLQIASSEYATVSYRPVLTVEFLIPEPMSAVPLGIGGLVLSWRRSRLSRYQRRIRADLTKNLVTA